MFYFFYFLLTPGTLLVRSLGLGRGCWDAEEAPISEDFSRKSSVPPCRFRGNTFVDEIPGGQCCDCQAAEIGGLPGHSWAPGQQGFDVRLHIRWLESSGCSCAQAHHQVSESQTTSLRPTRDRVMNLGSVMSAMAS